MEFQLSYFKPWKMMLLKCCTQHVTKSGKLSSGHGTGKSQFSFQTQRKALPKNCSNYHTIALISHTSKVVSKFSKPGFNSTRTMKFQMFKLDLEKAEEPEIRLPTCTGSLKKQENSRKMSSSSLTMLNPLLCGSQQTEKFFKRWDCQPPLAAS